MDLSQLGMTGADATQEAISPDELEVGGEEAGMEAMDDADFMELFLANINHQNPMEPMSSSEIMSQTGMLSQMQSVSRLTEATDRMTETMEKQMVADGAAFLGKEVEGEAEHGETIIGVVNEINQSGEDVMLKTDNGTIEMSSLDAMRLT